jgi:hypothetical protein
MLLPDCLRKQVTVSEPYDVRRHVMAVRQCASLQFIHLVRLNSNGEENYRAVLWPMRMLVA